MCILRRIVSLIVKHTTLHYRLSLLMLLMEKMHKTILTGGGTCTLAKHGKKPRVNAKARRYNYRGKGKGKGMYQIYTLRLAKAAGIVIAASKTTKTRKTSTVMVNTTFLRLCCK